MRSKILVVLIAVAVMGVSSAAMAKGAGGGGMGMHGHGHGHMGHHHHFPNNPFLFGDWGLGGYGDSGYGNTTVVAVPQATPQAAEVTGSITPCHLSAETFTVPSSAGGTRQVQVVACR
jgi:opacity protein-like surface antigen